MRRETQNILLVLLGGALLKIGINGDYLRYVKPGQQPWVLGGGAVILALGVAAAVRDVLAARHSREVGPQGEPEVGGHDHQHGGRTAWLLMAPVLAVLLIAPPALGSDSVARTQARAPQADSARSAAAFAPLPPGPVVPMTVSDFVARAGWDSDGTLDGRTVSLSGFVVHGESGTLLARMVVGCCAADAYPVTVRLPEGADSLASDAWVEVTGQVVPGTAGKHNRYTPDLTVESIREVSAPGDPYEY